MSTNALTEAAAPVSMAVRNWVEDCSIALVSSRCLSVSCSTISPPFEFEQRIDVGEARAQSILQSLTAFFERRLHFDEAAGEHRADFIDTSGENRADLAGASGRASCR